jgi:hypothetical protein
MRLILPGGIRYPETRAHLDPGELRDAVDAIHGSDDLAVERRPGKARSARDGAKREHEAVGDGGDEQRLRRPPIAWPAELRGRGGRNSWKPLAFNRDVAFRGSTGGD